MSKSGKNSSADSLEKANRLTDDADEENFGSSETVRVVDKRWWARADSSSNNEENPSVGKPAFVAGLEAQLETMTRKLEEKDVLLQDYAAKYSSATREFDDARTSLKRELSKDLERETRRILASLLEVVDNLDRAISAADTSEGTSSLHEGVVMVRQHFLKTLAEHGVQPINASGEIFDPNFHDAVSTVPVTETAKEGLIIDVVTPGYRVSDEVLRPTKVTVGKLVSPAPEPQYAR